MGLASTASLPQAARAFMHRYAPSTCHPVQSGLPSAPPCTPPLTKQPSCRHHPPGPEARKLSVL